MPIPAAVTDLNVTASLNSPQGTESAKGSIDDYFRAHAAFIRQAYNLTSGATTTLPSAATVNIGFAATNNIAITGTTTITAFDSYAEGAIRNVTFSGALTLTHNGASLILPGAANIVTVAGDSGVFKSLGSGNWKCLSYQRASGATVQPEFPVGTRMPFAQAAAPTGWTQDVSSNADNRMLRVINTAAHTVGGSHSPILNNVVPMHYHGFTTGGVSADHSHAVTDPGHTHGEVVSGRDNGAGGQDGNYPSSCNNPILEQNSPYSTGTGFTGISLGGMSADHTHSGTTDNGSSSTNWTPRYIDMIICAKA